MPEKCPIHAKPVVNSESKMSEPYGEWKNRRLLSLVLTFECGCKMTYENAHV